MLNAWRRHWNRHVRSRRDRSHGSVLNAWRRHWNRHRARNCRPHRECSTPGGVIGIGTSSLSSSDRDPQCSTPGGVIGIGTRAASASGFTAPVLNAWRRHWNRHVRSASVSQEWRVLNAWRRHWNRHDATRINCRATPAMVLNAWRRHWNRHACQSRHSRIGRSVLNAWRRHWNRHIVVEHRACFDRPVLNAWRRHWNRHADRTASRDSHRCSTPGGVIGIGTILARILEAGRDCAQRLAASLESARRCCRRRCRQPSVLNAWRRHWNRHSSNWRNMPSDGAQRLAASLESAPRRRCAGRRIYEVLNAWRRHWNRHAQFEQHRAVGHAVLNAWRRHWNRHRTPSNPCNRHRLRLQQSRITTNLSICRSGFKSNCQRTIS